MKPSLTICPTCGGKTLKLLRGDFAFKARFKTLVVPKLERMECSHCGEILFDYGGVKRLEEARMGRRKLSRIA